MTDPPTVWFTLFYGCQWACIHWAQFILVRYHESLVDMDQLNTTNTTQQRGRDGNKHSPGGKRPSTRR